MHSLEKLAHAYRKPLALFFFPKPPEGISYNTEFRTISASEIKNLPHKITRLMNEALVMQMNLQELEENPLAKENILHNKLKKVNELDVTRVAREILGITIEQQIQTKSSKKMLEIWRDAFSDQGIYVFKEAFSNDSISGFCIYDEQFPVIYLNLDFHGIN
jgi:hypothetical protein